MYFSLCKINKSVSDRKITRIILSVCGKFFIFAPRKLEHDESDIEKP